MNDSQIKNLIKLSNKIDELLEPFPIYISMNYQIDTLSITFKGKSIYDNLFEEELSLPILTIKESNFIKSSIDFILLGLKQSLPTKPSKSNIKRAIFFREISDEWNSLCKRICVIVASEEIHELTQEETLYFEKSGLPFADWENFFSYFEIELREFRRRWSFKPSEKSGVIFSNFKNSEIFITTMFDEFEESENDLTDNLENFLPIIEEHRVSWTLNQTIKEIIENHKSNCVFINRKYLNNASKQIASYIEINSSPDKEIALVSSEILPSEWGDFFEMPLMNYNISYSEPFNFSDLASQVERISANPKISEIVIEGYNQDVFLKKIEIEDRLSQLSENLDVKIIAFY